MKYLTVFCVLVISYLLQAQVAQAQDEWFAADDTFYLNSLDPLTLDILLNDVLPGGGPGSDTIVYEIGVEDTPNYGEVSYIDESTLLYTNTSDLLNFVDSFQYIVYVYETSTGEVYNLTAQVYIIAGCGEDCVWPGDANSDGIANAWDVLPIGQHYGDVGPARPDASIAWEGQFSETWASPIGEANDVNHVDCDGNGEINDADVIPIDLNYGLTHAKTAHINDPMLDLALFIEFTSDTIAPGATVNADIVLGNEDSLAEDVYGIAFSIFYPAELVDTGSLSIDFSESWLAADGSTSTLLSLYKDLGSGSVEAAITRTDQENTTGFGTLAKMSFVMEEVIISDKTEVFSDIPVELFFGSVTLLDKDGDVISINAFGDEAIIASTNDLNPSPTDFNFRLRPNPAHTISHLDWSTDQAVHHIQLFDQCGRLIRTETPEPQSYSHSLNIHGLARGIYFVKLLNNDSNTIGSRKLIVF